jgi:hypothetical protein
METNYNTHAEAYATIFEQDIDLNPKHPIFPPDFLEDEKLIYLNPQATFIQARKNDYSHIEVYVSVGNAPLQVNFLFADGKMEKDFVWIEESKTIKIPYREDSSQCSVYFLRKLNKGFCKAKYKFTKE